MTPWGSVIAAMSWIMIAATAWLWQHTMLQHDTRPSASEPWQHAREAFPVAEPVKAPPAVPAPVLQAIIKANPFSSQRRQAPPATSASPDHPVVAAPPSPKFVYKGRVQMGQKQRAVVEELSAKKTYFLEVGQDIAGFQVVRVEEEDVVLSNLQTHEELVVPLASRAAPTSTPKTTPGSRQPISKP